METSKQVLLTATDVSALLSKQIEEAGSQARWCVENQVSTAYLSDVLNGRRELGRKILEVLGLEAVTYYRTKEKMKSLTIKDGFGATVSYKAKVLPGTPPEMGTLYVLLSDDGSNDGKLNPKGLKITDGKNVDFLFFDCVEVVGSTAYGYTYMTRERSKVIGEFVSFD